VVCGVPTEVEVSPRMLQDLKLDGVLAIEEMK